MTEESTNDQEASVKKIDISTMNEQEMKELLQTMLKTAPNDAIKQGVQEQIDKINKNK
jgi:DNA-binding protein YbaB